MSRIGKKPVVLPAGVEVKVGENNLITVKGPKGELTQQISKQISVKTEDQKLVFTRNTESRQTKEQHGLARSLVANMVEGVTKGFEKKLTIEGVGYRAEKKGKDLVLHLGYSNEIVRPDPEGIETEAPKPNIVVVKGIDKDKVGNYSAKLRALRPPEPYKGKGVRYENEHVRRKEGKTGAK